MPRTVNITVPAKDTDKILKDIQKIEDLIGLRLQRGSSLKPKGDLITVETTNKSLPQLIQIFSKYKVGNSKETSFSTSQSISLISKSSNEQILDDTNESNWEEMEQTIAKDSNATINVLLLMFITGFIAAYGISTNAIHVVIGAMVIAPGFAPLLRVSLGFAARSRDTWRRGLRSFGKTYLALIAGAVASYGVMQLSNPGQAFGSHVTYLGEYNLLNYWSAVTASSIIVSSFASVAGALLIATNRSVLTGGVMIALALVPTAALVGIGIASMDVQILGASLGRFVIEVALVVAGGLAVFKYKAVKIHKRALLPEG